jgi:hypothetical protein
MELMIEESIENVRLMLSKQFRIFFKDYDLEFIFSCFYDPLFSQVPRVKDLPGLRLQSL